MNGTETFIRCISARLASASSVPIRIALGPPLLLALSACASSGGAPAPVLTAPEPTEPAVVEAPAPAPPEEVNAFVACRQRAQRNEIMIATASRRVHQTVCGAALWFDGLFGERELGAALDSSGRIEISSAYSEFADKTKLRLRFYVRVKLLALEKRLSAFAGIDDEDDFARDRTEGNALRSRRQPSDRDTFLLGLGYTGVTTDTFQSDFKVGVRNVRLPKVFVQNRFSYAPYSAEDTHVMLRLTPFWNNRDGFGTSTNASVDRTLAEAFLLRWATAGTISQESGGVDWRTAFILYQNLRGSRALAYEAFVRGRSQAAEALGEFGFRTVLREPFFGDRLMGELVVGYGWPRDDPALARDGAVDVGIGVEMPFGAARK